MRPLNELTAVTRRTKNTMSTRKNTREILLTVLLGVLSGLGALCDGARVPCGVQPPDIG